MLPSHIDLAEKLLAAQTPYTEVRAQLHTAGAADPSAVIKAVYDRWAAVPEDIEGRKAAARESLQRVFNRALEFDNLRDALKAMDLLCKIDGLYAPTRFDHQVTPEDASGTSERVRERLGRILRDHPEVVRALGIGAKA